MLSAWSLTNEARNQNAPADLARHCGRNSRDSRCDALSGIERMTNLQNEALSIARMAMRESREYGEDVSDLIHQICDSHECAIYYGKAIQFCADHNTDSGEQWLEDCGGIAQHGDSFGNIACRIAFATIYCAAMDELAELEGEDA